jgi:hypothetical protein
MGSSVRSGGWGIAGRAVISVGASAGGVLLLWLSRWSLVDLTGMCVNTDVRRVASPDRRREAVIFTRDCGATTGWGTNVSVVRPGAGRPRGPGNVFRAEWHRGAQPDSARGGPPVLVEWRAPAQLWIAYDDRVEVFMRRPTVGHINVEYVAARGPEAR